MNLISHLTLVLLMFIKLVYSDFSVPESVSNSTFYSDFHTVFGSETLYDINLLYANETSLNANEANATWFSSSQFKISTGFESSFYFEVRGIDGRATDGFAFVIQDVGITEIGGFGGNIGYDIFPTSVEIEFDLYKNNVNADPNNNHMAIQYGGSANHSTNTLAINETLGFNISQSGSHLCKIVYDPTNNYSLTVFVDNNFVMTANVDLAAQIDNEFAWIGFTASTGLTSTTVLITDWTLIFTPEVLIDPTTAQLTNSQNPEQSIGLWYNVPQQVSSGFSTNFSVRVDTNADKVFQGFSLVFQNEGFLVGAPGPYLGADIFMSNFASIVFMDAPSADTFYITPANQTTGFTQSSGFVTDLADGQTHNILISYINSLLTVCIDGKSSVLQFNLFEALNSETSYVGFTSSTADNDNNSAAIFVSDWSFAETSGCPCSDGYCYIVVVPTLPPTEAPTQLPTTQPPTTQPATTQPLTTQPATTEPPTTAPPQTTEPATTAAPTAAMPIPCLVGSVCLGSIGHQQTITINQDLNVNGNIVINGGTLILQDSKLANNQGSLQLSPQSSLVMNLSSSFVSSLNSSVIIIDGTVSINGNLTLTVTVPSNNASNFTISVISSNGSLSGQFNNTDIYISDASTKNNCSIYTFDSIYTQNSFSVLVTRTHNSACDVLPKKSLLLWQIIVISVGAAVVSGIVVAVAFVTRKRYVKRRFARTYTQSKTPQLVFRGSRSLSEGSIDVK